MTYALLAGDRFRMLALVTAFAGAGASFDIMRNAGRNQASVMLVAMFAAWVLAPFVVGMLAIMQSAPWPATVRASLHLVTIVLSPLSVAFYGRWLPMPGGAAPAAVFLVVPPASAVIATIVLAGARRAARREA